MAKYFSSVVAQQAAGSAIEWAGGVGFTRETGIEKYWRDSKIVSTAVNDFVYLSHILEADQLTRTGSFFLRVLSTRARQIFSSTLLLSSSRKSTHSVTITQTTASPSYSCT